MHLVFRMLFAAPGWLRIFCVNCMLLRMYVSERILEGPSLAPFFFFFFFEFPSWGRAVKSKYFFLFFFLFSFLFFIFPFSP